MKSILTISFVAACAFSYQTSFAQSSSRSVEEIKDKFERQVTNLHQEKIFIHTDRPSYITGETIWLSAYCVDAALHVPIDISKVLNVELLDISGQAVSQVRIKLEAGFGKGQIFVSPEIQSGFYTLRAYTNWMKNFGPDFAFHKQITIVNPSTVREIGEGPQSNNQAIINFFPESGDLVYGLNSRVAVKAADGFGDGLAITGVVFDNDDKEVAKFTTSKLGYASFFLTPESDKTYVALVELDSLIQKYQIPKGKQSGLTMLVNTTKTGDFNISIAHTKDFQKNLYLLVHSRGIIKKMLQIDLQTETEIALRKNELATGISHITLMDTDFNPLAERLVFKYPDIQGSVNLNIDKAEYQKRSKLKLSLKRNEKIVEGDLAHLSVSVFRSSGSNQSDGNILSNLLLTSDLKGTIPDPWIYFDPENKSRATQLDLVMLANGWRRFDWTDVKSDQNISITYPAEINAPILSGRVDKNDVGQLPTSLQLSFLGKASVMNSLDIDADGIFHFEVPFRVTNEMVYFFVKGDTLRSNQISVYSPFNLNYKESRQSKNSFTPDSKEYLETLNTNIQISQVYRDFIHINGLQSDFKQNDTHFYGAPDNLYKLDDYTRFETIKDLFIEYIRSAVIRDSNKKSGFYVVNEGTLPDKALLLIDGVPILDDDYIMNFDPLKIETISVVNDVYYIGSISHQGLIDFTTYEGDFDEQELPEYMIGKAYHGLQRTREFYAPNYAVNPDLSKRIPDFRNTLYWNPHITINGQEDIGLEFYTSDDTGWYQIEINGVTNSGKLIYSTTSFKVKGDVP